MSNTKSIQGWFRMSWAGVFKVPEGFDFGMSMEEAPAVAVNGFALRTGWLRPAFNLAAREVAKAVMILATPGWIGSSPNRA